MRSSRSEKRGSARGFIKEEPRDINQLGLDFSPVAQYSVAPRKETEVMNQELITRLENRINEVVEKCAALKQENARLSEEIGRFAAEREGLKSRVDVILGKLEGI